MESTATNVEGLYDQARKYTEDSLELYKLQAIDRTAVILSSIVARSALALIVVLFTLFINVGISLYLGTLLGALYLGFLVLSGFYVIIGVIVYFFKKEMIEKPIANLVIGALMQSTEDTSKIALHEER
jgi:hypothetical protein